jgi:site-specific DNA-methyltransferase (adenine-specific)
MVFTCQPWIDDRNTPKIHPTQKPVPLLESIIRTYTDIDDVVIDCCAGSGSTLLAAANLGRRAYGFELKREFVNAFNEKLLPLIQEDLFTKAEREEKKAKILELWG